MIRIKEEKSKMLNENISELKKSIKFDQESNKRSKFSITEPPINILSIR